MRKDSWSWDVHWWSSIHWSCIKFCGHAVSVPLEYSQDAGFKRKIWAHSPQVGEISTDYLSANGSSFTSHDFTAMLTMFNQIICFVSMGAHHHNVNAEHYEHCTHSDATLSNTLAESGQHSSLANGSATCSLFAQSCPWPCYLTGTNWCFQQDFLAPKMIAWPL